MVAKKKYVLYIMNYSRKKTKQGGSGGERRRTYFFEFPFLWKGSYFALGNSRQNKTSPLENPPNWAIPEKKHHGFPNSGKGLGDQKFYLGDFLPGEENLRRSDFENSNLCQT